MVTDSCIEPTPIRGPNAEQHMRTTMSRIDPKPFASTVTGTRATQPPLRGAGEDRLAADEDAGPVSRGSSRVLALLMALDAMRSGPVPAPGR